MSIGVDVYIYKSVYDYDSEKKCCAVDMYIYKFVHDCDVREELSYRCLFTNFVHDDVKIFTLYVHM